MDLKQDPRCYTDVCINGKWYHYDHCGTTVYQLKGGASPYYELNKEPKTEAELIAMLESFSH
ncbi:hypothetical protein C9I98_01035 [Photobacterium sanctipauli]|uniref:Uncharacterized protein n=1 Tax=Photobacterium sanctipauli TaxID=1342794 RepID=A0A2T3P078_9GAMM|nr:hypothetical protein [Photobacterium sanctipauli]PSW21882.1 hypothetical protein C9I98_01035 [Photobacterium sanctipauli]